MANIQEAISANLIKNGSIVVATGRVGTTFLTIDTHVLNDPDISIIATKYDARFDDPRYYTGDTAS